MTVFSSDNPVSAVVAFRCTEELYDILTRLADEHNIKKGSMARWLIAEALLDHTGSSYAEEMKAISKNGGVGK